MKNIEEFKNKVICGDCSEILQKFPSDSVDLIVTSPPYDDMRDYKGYNFDFTSIAIQLHRILAVGGVLVWVVSDKTVDGSESCSSFEQALFFKKSGLLLWDTMIFKKNSPSYPSARRYYSIFEYMFIFSKGQPKTVNLLKDRKNSYTTGSWGKRTVRTKEGDLVEGEKIPGGAYGVRTNIWEYNTSHGFLTKDKFTDAHPARFPDALALDHINSWSNPGDFVLDPMCGSGTVMKMAAISGRLYCGIDISDEYCEMSRKRLEVHELQDRIF